MATLCPIFSFPIRNDFDIIVSLMEIFELRYFLAVARFENVHRAAEHANLSPASLSKAVSRLESELSVKLFSREGRNIRLTDHGRVLQRRAAALVKLEEDARIEVGGHAGKLQVVIAAPEILLAKFGIPLTERIKQLFPSAVFEYLARSDDDALEAVDRGEAHLAITTSDGAGYSDLTLKAIGESTFQTYVGPKHPLHAKAKAKKTLPIAEVLEFPFASPTNPLLGKVGAKQSLDGWRDDQFPRKIEYRTSSLKTLEEFVLGGRAIAYLPDYFCESLDLVPLRISGCPYSCVQKVRLAAKHPKDVGWINRIF